MDLTILTRVLYQVNVAASGPNIMADLILVIHSSNF